MQKIREYELIKKSIDQRIIYFSTLLVRTNNKSKTTRLLNEIEELEEISEKYDKKYHKEFDKEMEAK